MNTHITPIRPDAIDADTLESQHTLLLGAPYVGKSYLLRDLALASDRHTRLDSALDARTDEFVVLDEFYTAYQGATDDHRKKFESWLDREGSVCVVARPREVDWLLSRDDESITPEFLNSFDEIFHLQYHPEDETDRDRAVECCLSILQDLDKDLSDRDRVDDELDQFCKTTPYEYDSDALQKLTEVYGETLVPALVIYCSDQLADGNGALFAEGVRACADAIQNASFSEFYDRTRDACSDLFSKETLSTLRSVVEDTASDPEISAETLTSATTVGAGALGAVAAPAGLVAGGSLAAYLYLLDRDGEEIPREAVFDVLLSDELTPTARAELEAELDLPPRTISNFRRLVEGGTIEELLHHRERVNEEICYIDNRLTSLEEAVEDHQEELQQVSKFFVTLEEYAVDHTDIASYVATSLNRATLDIEDFEQIIRAEEVDNLLQTGSLDGVPPYFGEEDNDIVKAVDSDSDELVVLQASHGMGKTTAAYRGLRELASRGYDVRLPNFDEPLTAIEYGLTSTSGETVVFASFKRGTIDKNTIDDSGQFRKLLAWLQESYCSTVILECRSELYQALDSVQADIESVDLKRYWWERTEPDFQHLSDEEISQTVKWVLDVLDAEGNRGKIVEEATRIAEGNPEIAKIAARFALREDQPLTKFSSYDELVWSDIDQFFKKETIVTEDGWSIGGLVFGYVAVLQQVTTDELLTLLGGAVTVEDLETCAEHLSGYLGGDVREKIAQGEMSDEEGDQLLPDVSDTKNLKGEDVWSLSPDIYGEVVFRQGCLGDGMLDRSVKYYLDNIEKIDNNRRYHGITANLAVAFQHGVDIDDEQLQRTATKEAHRVLERVDEDDDKILYVSSLVTLITSGVPVHPRYLKLDIEQIVDGFEALGEMQVGEFDGGELAMNRVANLYQNHLEFGSNEHIDTLDDATEQIASEYAPNYKSSGKFLSNVYSMAVAYLAKDYANPAAVEPWLDELEECAHNVSDATAHDLPPARFLENIYSMAISKLTQSHADPAAVEFWLDDLEARAQDTAADYPPDQFLPKVYSIPISNLARNHADPLSVELWLDDLEARAHDAAAVTADNFPPDQFLANVYSMAVSILAEDHADPAAVKPWLDELEARAHDTAATTALDSPPAHFLENVYSMFISRLADYHTDPAAVEPWLDELEARAHNAADATAHDDTPGQFLGYVYSMLISGFADYHTDPAAVEPWLDELEARARKAADATVHNMSPDRFITMTFAMAMGHIFQRPSPIPQYWYPHLVRDAVGGLEINNLLQFCQMYEEMLLQLNFSFPKMNIQLAVTTVELATGENSLGKNHDDRVARVATVLAGTLHLTWQRTNFEREYFGSIVAAVKKTEKKSPQTYEDLVRAVASILDIAIENTGAKSAWEGAF